MMMTSDVDVDVHATYKVVLRTTGEEPLVIRIKGETMVRLVEAWREVERERGSRITFSELMSIAAHRVLARRREE